MKRLLIAALFLGVFTTLAAAQEAIEPANTEYAFIGYEEPGLDLAGIPLDDAELETIRGGILWGKVAMAAASGLASGVADALVQYESTGTVSAKKVAIAFIGGVVAGAVGTVDVVTTGEKIVKIATAAYMGVSARLGAKAVLNP